MKKILSYAILPVVLGGFAACAPLEPDAPDVSITYTIPANIAGGIFDPSMKVSGMDLADSPCDPADGYWNGMWQPNWSPYDCVGEGGDPASPPTDHGNVQVFIDGGYVGSWSDVSEIDLSPKVEIAYIEWTDTTNDEVLDTPYAYCNFLFPDGPQGYNEAVAESLMVDVYYGGLLDVVDAATGEIITGQIDAEVWAGTGIANYWFSYSNDAISAAESGDPYLWVSEGGPYVDHTFQAQLAYDTHEVVYGGAGARVPFNFDLDEISSYQARNGLPWCRDFFMENYGVPIDSMAILYEGYWP